jgi:hypothetical protein
LCSTGELDWLTSPSTDYDGDGCRDESSEDPDDDNDGLLDGPDDCNRGLLDWISDEVNDYDQDGCLDSSEDLDDDEDGVSDLLDTCPLGEKHWTSAPNTDSDADGCRDGFEDTDYIPVEDDDADTEEDSICNPMLQNCENGEAEDKVNTVDAQSETEVKQLLLTILALAIIPTVIGVLYIAYRMKW